MTLGSNQTAMAGKKSATVERFAAAIRAKFPELIVTTRPTTWQSRRYSGGTGRRHITGHGPIRHGYALEVFDGTRLVASWNTADYMTRLARGVRQWMQERGK